MSLVLPGITPFYSTTIKLTLLPLFLLCTITTASAQVFTPRDIDLTVGFNNVSLPVTGTMSLLNGPGLKKIYVTATTDPAPLGGARQALKNYDAPGPLSALTIFTVDDTAGGLSYKAQVLCELNTGKQYYFPPATGLPTAGAAPAWNITSTATLVNFNFVDALNFPVFVNGGLILCEEPATGFAQGNLYLTSNTSQVTFLARGGSQVRFSIYVDLGGMFSEGSRYRKKFTVNSYVNSPLPNDTTVNIPVTIVTEIRYSIDGGPPVVLSQPNTANPSFNIDLSAVADGTHTITITALDPGGRESFVSGRFFRNAAGLTTQAAMILTWNCGVLQTSTDHATWEDVPGAASPFAVPMNEPRRFYQLRQP